MLSRRGPGMASELFQFTENLVDIAWIFSDDSAFQHQGIGLARTVTALAITVEALVRIQPYNVTAANSCYPHIGDLQIRRLRIIIYSVCNSFYISIC